MLINYGFREMTYDMDAIIQASSSMKDAINHVGDRLGLPNGWLNTDFMKTSSYTPKLIQYSKYYKTFSNVLRGPYGFGRVSYCYEVNGWKTI